MGGDRSAECQPVCELSFESILYHSTIDLCFHQGFLPIRRDSISHTLFQRAASQVSQGSPSLLFELLENPPDGSERVQISTALNQWL
jgi:hypothetical protein